jgi:hypothetical protein
VICKTVLPYYPVLKSAVIQGSERVLFSSSGWMDTIDDDGFQHYYWRNWDGPMSYPSAPPEFDIHV